MRNRILLLSVVFLFNTLNAQISFSPLSPPSIGFGSIAQRLLVASKDSIVVAAFDGIYTTVDGGASWNVYKRTRGFEGLARAKDRSLLIGDADGNLYRSVDWGRTWSSVPSYPANGYVVWRIAVDPLRGTIFTTDFSGKSYRSSDNGLNWTKMTYQGLGIDVLVTKSGDLLIADYYGGILLHSSNAGDAWDTVRVDEEFYPRSLFEATDGTILVGGRKGILKATRIGAPWTVVSRDPTIAITGNAQGILLAGYYADTLLVWDSFGIMTKKITGLSRAFIQDLKLGDNGDVDIATQGGSFRSTLRLDPWNQLIAKLPVGWVPVYGVAPKNDGSLFVGFGPDGVMKTSDAGKNWNSVNPRLLVDTISYPILQDDSTMIAAITVIDSTCNALMIDSSQTLFAAMNRGIYRLKNTTNLWEPILIDYSYHGLWKARFASDYRGTIYFMPFDGNMYRSDNGGNSWSLLSAASAMKRRTTISLDSLGIVYVGTDSLGLFRSKDRGISWTKILDGSIRSIGINSRRAVFALAGGNDALETGGDHIFRSFDSGATWTNSLLFYPNYFFKGYILFVDPDDNVVVDFNYLSQDDGNSWASFATTPSNQPVSYATDNMGFLYVGAINGNIYKSSLSLSRRLSIHGNAFNPFLSTFGISGKLNSTSVATLTMNNRWELGLPFTFTSTPLFTMNPSSGVVGPHDSTIVAISYTPKQVGSVSDATSLYWDYGSIPFTITGYSESKIWFYAPVKKDNVDIFSISDSLNFAEVRVDSLAKKSPMLLYTSSVGNSAQIDSMRIAAGRFSLTAPFKFPLTLKHGFGNDFDVSVTPRGPGRIVDSLMIFSNTEVPVMRIILTASAFGAVSAVQTDNSIPREFSLAQNFPNPFNPSTCIRYGLPRQSRVRLLVYNMLGQVVAELINANQSAGWNQVTWNANGASGMYFCRLEAAPVSDPGKRFVNTKKMILLH
jgi:photosystem II stability/assembly factor-like uncharacterized protein